METGEQEQIKRHDILQRAGIAKFIKVNCYERMPKRTHSQNGKTRKRGKLLKWVHIVSLTHKI
jgi:hypothetical protein